MKYASKTEKAVCIPLTQLAKGACAQIFEVHAGKQVAHRLSTLGMRPGVRLRKISAFVLRGPITVKIGATVIALGHGMAEKVIVSPVS